MKQEASGELCTSAPPQVLSHQAEPHIMATIHGFLGPEKRFAKCQGYSTYSIPLPSTSNPCGNLPEDFIWLPCPKAFEISTQEIQSSHSVQEPKLPRAVLNRGLMN